MDHDRLLPCSPSSCGIVLQVHRNQPREGLEDTPRLFCRCNLLPCIHPRELCILRIHRADSGICGVRQVMQMSKHFVLNDERHLNLLPSFSSLSMQTICGRSCIYPFYKATKAVCTPDEDDDKEWLQYWMLGGLLFMLTTWVDDSFESGPAHTKWLGCLIFYISRSFV
jgi:hypothetical protein